MNTETLTDHELDILVAEKVLGWTLPRTFQPTITYHHNGETKPLGPPQILKTPKFSTDTAAAWLVVERMAELGVRWRIENVTAASLPQGSIYCLFVTDEASASVITVGIAHAICEAALAWAEGRYDNR